MAAGIICVGSPAAMTSMSVAATDTSTTTAWRKTVPVPPGRPPACAIIIGIDPGMSRCGWAMLRHNLEDPTEKPYRTASGVWETSHSKGQSIWARSRDLCEAIQDTLREYFADPAEEGPRNRMRAAVEAPAYGARFQQHNVSHCRGVLAAMLPATGHEIFDIIDITPTELKRRVLGQGVAGDKQAVKDRLPQLVDNVVWQTRWLDESDALAVAYAAWQQNLDGFQSNAPQSANV